MECFWVALGIVAVVAFLWAFGSGLNKMFENDGGW